MTRTLALLALLLPGVAWAQQPDMSASPRVSIYSVPAQGSPTVPLFTLTAPGIVTVTNPSSGGSSPSGTVGTAATGNGAASPVFDAATGLGLETTNQAAAANTTLSGIAAVLGNTTGTGSLAMGTAGTQTTITNPNDGTLRVRIAGLTASGGTIGFYATDAASDTPYVVGGINGAANTRYTVASADGSYTFNVTARSSLVLRVATAGTGMATFTWEGAAYASLITLDTSPGGPAFAQLSQGGAVVSATNGLPTADTLLDQTTAAAGSTSAPRTILMGGYNGGQAIPSGNQGALAIDAMGRAQVISGPGTANIGRTSLPTGTGAAASGSTTIATASTYQTLFAAGGITNGCYIQNPSSNSAVLEVDWTGATGTTLAPTSQDVYPGQTVPCAFVPTNAVTVFSTGTISFRAGKF